MYPQYGDARFPAEFGPSQGQLHMNPSAGPGRYGYPGYYDPKGLDSGQYSGATMPRGGAQQYGGKPGAMAGQDPAYGPGWSPAMQTASYVGPGSKQSMGKMDYPYPMQPDMYPRVPQGYPDSISHPGMGGYPGPPSYGPSPQYPSQYPYGSPRHSVGLPPGVMAPAMDGYPDSLQSSQQTSAAGMVYPGAGSWPADLSRRAVPPGMSRGWSQDMAPHQPAGSWPYRSPDGYPPGAPPTPGQSQPQQQSQPSQQPSQQAQPPPPPPPPPQQQQGAGGGTPVYGQQSQSLGVLSPHTPYSGELQKQPSVSSLRDALLATTPSSQPQQQQQYPSYSSPRVNHPSPMTPSANLPATPDASTPVGSSNVMSPPLKPPPPFVDRQDSQLSAAESELLQSFSRQNSEAGPGPLPENPLGHVPPARVSPFQVESILGIKDDKPAERVTDSSHSNSSGLAQVSGQDGNTMQSPPSNQVTPIGEHPPISRSNSSTDAVQNAHSNSSGRPESIPLIQSPTFGPHGNQASPSVSEETTVAKIKSSRKVPVMSPVDRSHPSIMSQYKYSNEQQRKEFLDTLFAHLEKEGIPLLRLPTICKQPLDLYKAYNSVQQLGGFMNVIEKHLWHDVLRSFSSSASNANSNTVKSLQQCYVKLLLPYECHVRNLSFSDCVARLENSRHDSSTPTTAPNENKKMNHTDTADASKLDDAALEPVMEGKMNGNSQPLPRDRIVSEEEPTRRMSSHDSDASSMHMSSQEDSQISSNVNDSQTPSQEVNSQLPSIGLDQGQKEDGLDIPEGSQNSVDTYSQGISSTDPLPDITVQEAESLLGMSPSPYPASNQPAGGPGTPSGTQQNAPSPSPSYPPPFHQQQQQNSRDWPSPAPDYMSGLDMSDPNMMIPPTHVPAPSNPPGYPPSYPMDPLAGYRPPSHPSPMHPAAYSPYSTPAQAHPDLPPEFQHRIPQSPMMRSRYMSAGHYPPGMSPPMHMGPSPGQQMLEPNPYSAHYRPAMMPQPNPMMRRMADMGYPGAAMSPADWQWSRSRFPSPLPPHMQSSGYGRHIAQHPASPRLQTPQQAAVMAALHQSQHRASPGHPPQQHMHGPHKQILDPIQIHWQDQVKSSQMSKMLEKPSPKPFSAHPGATANKTLPSKPSSEQQQHSLMENLKRPLPNWSNCIEGTRPQLVKRKRLLSGDCGHVEPWRVMMSLKSGVLAESTWALDTLNILLHDDRTVGFFYLKHHHSLLNTLVDHFRRILVTIFGNHFDELPKYTPGYDGVELTAGGAADSKEREMFARDWLAAASTTDYDALSSCKLAKCNGNGNGEERSKEEEECENSIPVANVFDPAGLKLGRSDDLSHIQLPTVSTKLLFPETEDGPEMMQEDGRQELENQSRLQRIDQTPVSELLRREAVLSQIPLHRFGRLSRSPRRRERSILEDMELIESMTKETERAEAEAALKKKTVKPAEDGDVLANKMAQDEASLPKMMMTSPVKGSLVDRGEVQLSKEAVVVSKAAESSPRKEGTDDFKPSEDGTNLKPVEVITRNAVDETARKPSAPLNSSPVHDSYKPMSPGSPLEVLREESEIHQREALPLWSVSPSNELIKGRCVCVSNILRSLSFIPGNDLEFSQHPGLLVILGQLLMLRHSHLLRSRHQQLHPHVVAIEKEERNEAFEGATPVPQQPKTGRDYWWWECLDVLRENSLVVLSNIAGQMDLSIFPEAISYPLVNGLLHWAVCPSAQAVDPLPDSALVYSLSPQRLVLETLAKMSISEINVDFLLATPPLTRLDLLFSQLVQLIGQKKHPVMRQFALVLLSNLAQGNETTSRLIGQQKLVVSLLLECIESAEHTSCASNGHLVGGFDPNDPNSLSVAMLRRAATTLHCLAKVPPNRTAFLPFRDRLLYLATSQYVEPSVSSILMDMLFELGKL